ncbi:DUF3265 domain-containing protein [Vibrio sp. B1-2]|nr:DUF3265 domain-containing protein [Vibrio anguillarum]NNN97513.1 DUF3265 domain-containing protein [Vibrio sp. B4-6]NNN99468.1 DUF3265 domain-containing protein [Vibrio sp. B1-2]PSD43269.1 DUF3265 domain-containing protein [Vibrio sp. V02_P2A34T13]
MTNASRGTANAWCSQFKLTFVITAVNLSSVLCVVSPLSGR